MQTQTLTITNKLGLHARVHPASSCKPPHNSKAKSG